MAKSSVRRTAHAQYDLWYHIAWATKYRKKVLNNKIRDRVKGLFRIIAAHHDSEISNLEVLEDHVHILIFVPPRITPARIVQFLKSYSTHVLFREFPQLRNEYWRGGLWIAGYFIRSVGPGLTKKSIDKYISSQERPRDTVKQAPPLLRWGS